MGTKALWNLAFLLFFPSTLLAQTLPEPSTIKNGDIEWNTERIDKGIYWKTYHGKDYFDAKLNINIIEVWLDSSDYAFKIGHASGEGLKTSEFGKQFGALAAINGSFFDMEGGGSMVFLKSGGEIISNGAPANNFYTENGAFSWSDGESPEIIPRPEKGWDSVHHTHILSSGPLLLRNGETAAFKSDPFHQNRHPRTAVAVADSNRVIFVTVDGRSFQSYGMTIPELADFLKLLGAESALNLDGGGSSAMWIAGKNEHGIVNYPSDNLEFDHLGERIVANSLLLLVNRQ